MRQRAQLQLLLVAGLGPPVVAATFIQDLQTKLSLLAVSAVSYVAFRWTVFLVPLLAPRHVRAGLVGKDLNKKGTLAGEKPVPEGLGLVPGVVCLASLAVVQMVHHMHLVPRLCRSLPWCDANDGAYAQWDDDFPAALASIALMLMLGFVDDVLDLPWRVKLVMPVVAAAPLLAAYSGATAIGIPRPLRLLLGLEQTYVELGLLYHGYMLLLVIFCTNAINILAGVNGLEAGQTFVVAGAILTHAVSQLVRSTPAGSEENAPMSSLFAAYIVLPLMATTFGLLTFNWYPSQVFVGDTFTYFAGMTIAVAGILGHFSETLLVFLIPQLFNFVYSLPQLFGLVHCPRHRLPTFDAKSGLLTATPNWNLVNLMLQVTGRCSEVVLCARILLLQFLTCTFGVVLHILLPGVWK